MGWGEMGSPQSLLNASLEQRHQLQHLGHVPLGLTPGGLHLSPKHALHLEVVRQLIQVPLQGHGCLAGRKGGRNTETGRTLT